MIFKIIGGKAVRYDSGGTEKIDDLTVDFSQAESRENISSADNVRTILGKVMKWFSDLSAGAASSLLGQNLTAGKVLVSDDGGKVSASAVDASKVGFLSGVTGDVQTQINSLNSAMNSISGSDTTALTSQTLQALKSRWESLPNSTIDIMTFTGTSASALASCVYFKLNNEYGCALIMSYYIQRPVFVRLYGGDWYGPMRI